MTGLLLASLVVNVAVLVPVVAVLLFDTRAARDTWGPRSPGRQILLAIYLSILALSVALLVWGDARVSAGLLLAQVVYKVLSPVTVGTLKHPVVLSNLAIAALHTVTLISLMKPAVGVGVPS